MITINFKHQGQENIDLLKSYQPNKPLMVTEFWTGWFDHWFAFFHGILLVESKTTFVLYVTSVCKDFENILHTIFVNNGNVNFYIFSGGTNFGFLHAGNVVIFHNQGAWPYFAPDVTSYGNTIAYQF